MLTALFAGVLKLQFGAILAALAIGLFPVGASIWALRGENKKPMGEALFIFSWTVLASLIAVSTGGMGSPAIILFAIGPLTAFVFGKSRLAAESAAFSVLAYIIVAALDALNMLALPQGNMTALGSATGATGIVQSLMLVAMALKMGTKPNIRPDAAAQTVEKSTTEAETKTNVPSSEDLLKERNAYFASLSHDLRSPFTAILGYAEAFKMNLSGNLTNKQIDQASIIHESAEDLLALVDDMMDLAKSEAGKMSIAPEPIHLGDLGKSIMLQMQAMADRKDVEMAIDTYGEPWAMADARLVRRIWQNLISNAIKYSEPGSTVQLSTSERARHAILCVRDSGRGMSKEDLARIAKPFEMGSNANGKAGTGLGLVNVQRFTEMHGGQVIIDSAPGEGAQFQVILPKADIEELGPL